MSNRCYDLHCHSNQSDGILSPEALVSRAKTHQVSVLALTDHDTTAGLASAEACARDAGIEFINGVEFSCLWEKQGIHIVALDFDREHRSIVQAVQRQSELRKERCQIIGEKLEKLGFHGVLEKAYEIAGDASAIGRPHFAQALVELSYVANVNAAFKKYLGAGKAGDVKQLWPEFEEILPLVREAGGVAVVAHPLKYKMTRSKLCRMIEDFVESGGEAIEVASGIQRPDQTRDMAKIAQTFGLMASCGSDFHAPGQHWAELGKISAMPDNVDPVWVRWESSAQ
jgi:predicted metal-dependent phosphoesterase TrpH